MSESDFSIPMTAKGKRPHVFDDPAVDHVMAILLELAGEVWTLRDRQAALEAFMAEKNGLSAEEIEAIAVPGDKREALDAERATFIRRIFRTLESEI